MQLEPSPNSGGFGRVPERVGNSADRHGRRSRVLPFLVLALGIAVTLVLSNWVSRQLELNARLRFERAKDLVTADASQQFKSLEEALTAGRSLIDSNPAFTHAQWSGF